jgi:hypothetical protein
MTVQEINESIKMETLQSRLENINECLVGKNLKFILEEENTNDIFNYTLKGINKLTKEVMTIRVMTDKNAVLQYIAGLEKGIALMS